jgi:hypothetical protein
MLKVWKCKQSSLRRLESNDSSLAGWNDRELFFSVFPCALCGFDGGPEPALSEVEGFRAATRR